MENKPHANPATPEEIWAILRSVSEKQEKSAEEAEKRRKEADRRMKKLEGLFTSQWGTLMESLVEGDLVALLQERGIEVESTHSGWAVAAMASTMSLTSWPLTVRSGRGGSEDHVTVRGRDTFPGEVGQVHGV